MKKVNILLMICFYSLNVAADMPDTVRFKEGESIRVTFSKTNLNRLFVKGEKITAVRFPEKAFAIEKPEEKELEAGLDSLYLKPTFEGQLTLFVTTNKNHNFSIQASSDNALGRTIQMIPSKLVSNFEKHVNVGSKKVNDSNLKRVSQYEQIIKAMSEGNVPEGFNPQIFSPQYFFFKKNIKAKPVKIYKSNALAGYVYEFQNKTKNPIVVDSNWFSKDSRVKAIHIDNKNLNPYEKSKVYLVYSELSRSIG